MRALPRTVTDGFLDAATLKRWMRAYRPDVIIDSDERHVLDLLAAGGWRVPEEVELISLCVDRQGGPLSGCVQHGGAIGLAGVDQLVSLVERNETGLPAAPVPPATLATDVTWNDGKTLIAGSP